MSFIVSSDTAEKKEMLLGFLIICSNSRTGNAKELQKQAFLFLGGVKKKKNKPPPPFVE